MPERRSSCTWRTFGPIGSTTGSSAVYRYAPIPAATAGALARVRVERFQSGARPDVDLADVLVGRLDVGPVGRIGRVMISRHVMYALRAGRRVDRPELLAPASGHHGVQPLHDGLGADVGRDLRAAERVAARGTFVIARKPIAPGANGRRSSVAASAWVRAVVGADVCSLRTCVLPSCVSRSRPRLGGRSLAAADARGEGRGKGEQSGEGGREGERKGGVGLGFW